MDSLNSGITAEDFDYLSLEEKHKLKELITDNELLEPSLKNEYSTNKIPSGPLDLKKLHDFLEQEAFKTGDIIESRPFIKKTRKVKNHSKKEKFQSKEDPLFKALTPKDLNTVNELLVIETETKIVNTNIIKSTPINQKYFIDINLKNDSDLNVLFESLNSNMNVSVLNLNNHININDNYIHKLLTILENNSSVTELHMANISLNDSHSRKICQMVKLNKSIKVLNIESNRFTHLGIENIFESLLINQTLNELHVNNQPGKMGIKLEEKMVEILNENKALYKFGYTFENATLRLRANRYLDRNRPKRILDK